MQIGFVFGKFLPFHKGHEAMLAFAMQQCDRLIVLVCCSDKENISSIIRVEWIQDTFQDSFLRILALDYKESELPNTSVSSRSVSKVWAKKFKEILPEATVLISSELYGQFVAEYMGISHIEFDKSRQKVPISATLIRKNPMRYWDFLPDAVKPFFQKKIAILGTESTGKSTLARNLSTHYSAPLVEEAGRLLIPNSGRFTKVDLEKTAILHASWIEKAQKTMNPLLILDTNIFITQSYAHFTFGTFLDFSTDLFEVHKSDLNLYLNKDAHYVQDGTRLDENRRNQLDVSHRNILAHFGVTFVEVGGAWEERFEKAVSEIDKIWD